MIYLSTLILQQCLFHILKTVKQVEYCNLVKSSLAAISAILFSPVFATQMTESIEWSSGGSG